MVVIKRKAEEPEGEEREEMRIVHEETRPVPDGEMRVGVGVVGERPPLSRDSTLFELVMAYEPHEVILWAAEALEVEDAARLLAVVIPARKAMFHTVNEILEGVRRLEEQETEG